MMMFYPYLLDVVSSASIVQCVSIFLCFSIVFHYRKEIRFRLIIPPLAIYFPVYLFLLSRVAAIKSQVSFLKPFLGAFLIILSIYLLLTLKRPVVIKPGLPTALVCASLSAVIDAFFALGGPPMVLYFLGATTGKREYLGTIQCFFLITCLYGTGVRVQQNILTPELLTYVFPVCTTALLGIFIGNRLTDKIDALMLKKLVYLFIGISGIITFAA